MRTAYKCRAYPTGGQAALLARTFGCVRVVWNQTLAWRHERWHQRHESTSYKQADAHLTELKRQREFVWLNEVSSVPLQQTLRHQHAAFVAFYQGRARYPRFKSRTRRQSATYTRSAFRMHGADLRLAKTAAPLAYVWSWPDVDPATLDPTSVTVSRDPDGRWFVVFHVETDDPAALPDAGSTVGVDVGLKDFAILSTGERIAHPQHMDKHERRLKRYQRVMARRKPKPGQRGSNNYAKAKRKVARQHSKVGDARRDQLHKLSTRLVRDHDVVVVEDLAVSNMVRNRTLSKAISRSGWRDFRTMLEYKAERYGRRVVVVDRWYPSSKTCSECGHLLAKLDLKTRRWACPGCGTLHDRDVNAAKNLVNAAGLAVRGASPDACGGGRQTRGAVQSPSKQEPQRATVGIPRL